MTSDTQPTVFLTFRTYGSWLHGDERGSVDRRRNRPSQERIPEQRAWQEYERSLMTHPAVVFSEDQRTVVSQAITLYAQTHGWRMYALNVRSNHVHVVAAVNGETRRAIVALKAAATAALRRAKRVTKTNPVWSRGGSVRRLETARAIETACKYVVEEQGRGLGDVGLEY